MAISQPSCQSDAALPPIVAFDFDGTLTCHDSFVAFLAWRAGPARYAAGLVKLLPELIRYALARDRARLKSAAARDFLGGSSIGELEHQAEHFASECGGRLLRPDALRCWGRWRDDGARMVIVTASPHAVVAPFARQLCAEHLFASQLALDAEGRVTGALAGANCRGPEKVARLRAAFGPNVRLAAAYGDTSGDREMLALADEAGMRAFKGRP